MQKPLLRTVSVVAGGVLVLLDDEVSDLAKVLILGCSRKVSELLRDFDGYGETFAIEVMSGVPLDDRNRTLALYDDQSSAGQIRHIEKRYTAPDTRQNLGWAISLGYPINRHAGFSIKYLGTRAQESVGFDSDTVTACFSYSV